MTPIRYAIAPLAPEAHLFAVTVTVSEPDPAGQRFTLPAWIPGSYMIRDFARHIVRIRADAGGREVPLTKLDKQGWQAAPVSRGGAGLDTAPHDESEHDPGAGWVPRNGGADR